jgi:hypothetical protein
MRPPLDSFAARDSDLPEVQERGLGDETTNAPGPPSGEGVMSKSKRTKGDGSLYLRGRIWWIAYKHPDGTRTSESSKSDRRAVALRLLRKQTGAGVHNLPVIKNAEQLTFYDAAQMVTNDFKANHVAYATERTEKKSLAVIERRINKHLTAYFGIRRCAPCE